MKLNKFTLVFAYISIALIFVFLSTATYAFLSEDKNYLKLESELNENISVKFENTSNISMVNIKSGDELLKEFTVKNKNINIEYYDILLEDVINNIDFNDIAFYTLTSQDGAYVNETYLPSNDRAIASNIKLSPLEKHKYTLYIKFKDNVIIDNNKTFSAKIKVIDSKDNIVYKKRSIGMKMIGESNGSYKANENHKEGIYYTNNSINGKTVYFYYGSDKLNNNAILGNSCYKIIRTSEDGGIKLIYNGYTEDYKCLNNTDNILNEMQAFNLKSDFNAYIGYMYGEASSNNYDLEHSNVNSSNAKNILDDWYEENISKFNDMIDKKSIYCNNRSLSSFKLNGVLYDKNGYGKLNSGYEVMSEYINRTVSYDCLNINDRFSLGNIYGNDMLNNSIGLISAEEVYFSGFNEFGTNSFLYSKTPYWTMTGAYFNGSTAYNFIVDIDKVSQSMVNLKHGLRPVITLKPSTLYLSGNGSNEHPYILF